MCNDEQKKLHWNIRLERTNFTDLLKQKEWMKNLPQTACSPDRWHLFNLGNMSLKKISFEIDCNNVLLYYIVCTLCKEPDLFKKTNAKANSCLLIIISFFRNLLTCCSISKVTVLRRSFKEQIYKYNKITKN